MEIHSGFRELCEELFRCLQIAAGSGISPIKSVIESGQLNPMGRKRVHLFYGTKDKGDVRQASKSGLFTDPSSVIALNLPCLFSCVSDSTAYQELVQSWEEAGVKVTQVRDMFPFLSPAVWALF